MTAHRFLPFWWLLLAGASVGMRLVSEGIIDSGDGIQHYHIARGSWSSPMLLLDHWGNRSSRSSLRLSRSSAYGA
ncbi:MAG: hypothetical protein IPJ85_10625 [Flavobacteriales bacterium]|nr:hypothetical protein [Flavobacteriales bacterium]